MRSNLLDSTARVIARFGRTISYLRVQEGTYDVNTSKMTEESILTESVTAYRTKISYSESQSPSLIGKDTAVYLVAGKSITFIPSVGDRVVDFSDGSDYQVVLVSKIDVQDKVGAWRLICCRS